MHQTVGFRRGFKHKAHDSSEIGQVYNTFNP